MSSTSVTFDSSVQRQYAIFCSLTPQEMPKYIDFLEKEFFRKHPDEYPLLVQLHRSYKKLSPECENRLFLLGLKVLGHKQEIELKKDPKERDLFLQITDRARIASIEKDWLLIEEFMKLPEVVQEQLLRGCVDAADKNSVLTAYSSLPPATRALIVTRTLALVDKPIPGCKIAKMMELISTIGDKYDEVLLHARPLFTRRMLPITKAFMLEALYLFKERETWEQWDKLVKKIQRYLGDLKEESIPQFFAELNRYKMCEEIWSDAQLRSKSLLPFLEKKEEVAFIIIAVAAIERWKWDAAYQQLKPFLKPGMKQGEILSLVKTMASVGSDNWPSVHRLFLALAHPCASCIEKMELMTLCYTFYIRVRGTCSMADMESMLRRMQCSDKKMALTRMLPLLTLGKIRLDQVIDMFELIPLITSDQGEKILSTISTILREMENFNKAIDRDEHVVQIWLNLFILLSTIKVSTHQSLIKAASSFLKTAQERDVVPFLATLALFPPVYQNSLATLCQPLLTPSFKQEELRQLMKCLYPILEPERSTLISHLITLNGKQLSLKDKREVILALREIPDESRQEVCVRAQSFLHGLAKGSEIGALVQHIYAIPLQSWHVVNTRMQPYLAASVNGVERVALLEAINQISLKEWDAIEKGSLYIISRQETWDKKVAVMLLLHALPKEQWNEALIYAKLFITPQVSSSDALTLALKVIETLPKNLKDGFKRAIGRLTPDIRYDLVKESLEFIISCSSVAEQDLLLSTLADIPAKGRLQRRRDFEMIEILDESAQYEAHDQYIPGRKEVLFLSRKIIARVSKDMKGVADVVAEANQILLKNSMLVTLISFLLVADLKKSSEMKQCLSLAEGFVQTLADSQEMQDATPLLPISERDRALGRFTKYIEEIPKSQRIAMLQKAIPLMQAQKTLESKLQALFQVTGKKHE